MSLKPKLEQFHLQTKVYDDREHKMMRSRQQRWRERHPGRGKHLARLRKKRELKKRGVVRY